VSFEYDARGNVVKRTDAGAIVTYRYDGLDRMTSLQATAAQGGTSLAYTYRYDENGYAGRLTTVVEPERTVTFTYDGAGRLRSEVLAENGVAVPLTTQYGYDAGGALTQLTYPSGLTVRFDRDPATGEVTAVSNVSSGYAYASTVKHLPGGPVTALTFGNGRTLTQTFNLRSEPLTVQSGPLWLTYTPTPAGDLSVVADQSEDASGCVRNVTRELKYDFQDRLAGWSDVSAGGVGVCPVDAIGSQVGAFTYVSGTDRMASQRVPDLAGPQAYAYGYDGAGSLSAIGKYDGSGTVQQAAVCLRHDLLGRLVLAGTTSTVVSPGGTACTSDGEVTAALGRFKYDARNRRVARQVGGQWTYVVSDGSGSPLSELALTGGAWTKVRDYVWLDGRLLAQVEYAGTQVYEYFAHLDHLGTPRALSNRNGQVVWSTYQRPYGEVLERTVVDPVAGRTVVTNVRLPGQYDERLLGSVDLQGPYYNWNRWYLPSAGRYLEPDTIALAGEFNGAFGPDWYAYAYASPARYTDPEGREAATIVIGGGAAIGGGVVVAAVVVTAGVGVALCLAIEDCRINARCGAKLVWDVLKCASPTATARQCPEDPERCLRAAKARYKYCKRTRGHFEVIDGGAN
jgi:RHS repeat-associated protein